MVERGIINCKIIQVMYQLKIFKPPKKFFTDFGKIILPFFKITVRRIGKIELAMDCMYEEGGLKLNLQDLETKTTSMRIKHQSEAIEDWTKFPFVDYFIHVMLMLFNICCLFV